MLPVVDTDARRKERSRASSRYPHKLISNRGNGSQRLQCANEAVQEHSQVGQLRFDLHVESHTSLQGLGQQPRGLRSIWLLLIGAPDE
jgi:hypothetical protein